MEVSTDLIAPHLFWPTDLKEVGLTEQERSLLEQKIQSGCSALSQKTPERRVFDVFFRSSEVPRECIVNDSRVFVFLGSSGGKAETSDQKGLYVTKTRRVWECVQGKYWHEVVSHSPEQDVNKALCCIRCIQEGPDMGLSQRGLPELTTDLLFQRKAGLRYLEEAAELSLFDGVRGRDFSLHTDDIRALVDALRKIHDKKYSPATFFSSEGTGDGCGLEMAFDIGHTLFHGNISPNAVVCQKAEKNSSKNSRLRLMLTDFASLGDLKRLVWTAGFGSPETIQFVQETGFQEECTETFLARYGAKKDTWAMGLLLGFLLLGKKPSRDEQILPCFSFITKKLVFDDLGNVTDEAGLANITQEEVDSEIDPLMEASLPDRKELWRCVKEYLTVDPDKRPTAAECFSSLP